MHLSPKELMVFEGLFKFRGGRVDDLSMYVYGKRNKSSINNTYRSLRTLRNNGLLEAHSMFLQGETKHFYFLSKEGIELANIRFDIPEGYVGTGYGNDHGDFAYSLYKPPQRLLKHHLLTIEFLLQCHSIASKTDEHTFSYRDNRYASKIFISEDVKGKETYERTFRMRPDAEIRINSNEQWAIEIDLASESSAALTEKFKSYARYIRAEEDLPYTTILFVAPYRERVDTLKRRWETIQEAFIKGMGEFTDVINLRYIHSNDVQRTLTDAIHSNEYEKRKLTTLQQLLFNDAYNGTEVFTIDKGFNYYHKPTFASMTYGKEGDVLFVYHNIEGYETSPWISIKNMENHFGYLKKSPDFTNVKKLVHILFAHEIPSFISTDHVFSEKTGVPADRMLILHTENDKSATFSRLTGEVISLNPLIHVDEALAIR